MKSSDAIARFDPVKVGKYETENWVAYYQKDWLKLLQVSAGMVKESFKLSLPQAIYGAYLVGRAEIAAAPADNDIPLAEAYMRRFYAMVKQAHAGKYDVEKAAALEVKWWIVHRELFGKTENESLIEALQNLYVEIFQIDCSRVRRAAERRAEAMIYSDQWVNEGRQNDSPLIGQIEIALIASYAALKEAVQSPVATAQALPAS
jgi:hypothetical protein